MPTQLRGARASVLIVEDDETIREVWTRYLSSVGYQVTSVKDAEHALLALPHQPHVAISDIQLPGQNGPWLAAQIREMSPATAIILATADHDTPPPESLRPEVIAFLPKPFGLALLKSVVEEAVQWSMRRRNN